MTFLAMTASVASALAEIHYVSSAAEISAAMSVAQPGDTLVMTDGVWQDQQIAFAGFGTAQAPITLKAQSLGGVVLTGSSQLKISGQHLVVDGLTFEDGRPADDHVIAFNGPLGHASHSRLTNTTIRDYNPDDINERYFWVSLYGQDNRVDHSRFEGQDHSGVTLVAWLDGNEARHRIDNNHFLDRPEGNDNGFETIRLGTSSVSDTNARIIVENNLFERVDGEIEIISNKSNENTFRYNTFRDSKGTLTLRHGHRATVDGNFFLGNNKNGSGGVRVIGEDHVITNNYFADLDDRADGVISISAGIPNTEPSGYQQVKNALIAHNTIVSADMPGISFDAGFGTRDRTLLAEDVSIIGNLITGISDSVFEGQEGTGWTWASNLVNGAPLGISPRPGVTEADPMLVLAGDGLYRPGPGSPAIDAIAGTSLVPDDMDGQARIGLIDIGADEVLPAAIVRKPLTATDVGPDAQTFSQPIPDPLPSGSFITIEAEAYTLLLDPDNDGETWQTVSDPYALSGSAIKAPAGSRSDASNHEAIVGYELVFAQPGTYTAYYRARGFNTSADSIFQPDTFGTDPDLTASTTSSGVWQWETGQAFTVTPGMVGVPLELRIGRREGLTELDALVFHTDSDLDPGQLQSLFQLAPGDFDGSGALDAQDLILLANAMFSSDTNYDMDDSGQVDVDDLNLWLTELFGTVLGDVNLDLTVDLIDLSTLASHFGEAILIDYTDGDLNLDGTVNLIDLSILATGFGQQATIPEPVASSLLTLTLLLQRR